MDRTNAERQRRYIAKLKGKAAQAAADKGVSFDAAAYLDRVTHLTDLLRGKDAEIAQLKARIAELEAEPQQQRQPPPFPHPRTPEEWEALKARATAERSAKRATAKAARAAATLAEPGAPDAATLLAENETLKQQLKATQTRNSNLKRELSHISKWHKQEMAKAGGMTFATQSKIARVLHPDSRKQATEAQIEEACKLFTAWKADRDKAGRERR